MDGAKKISFGFSKAKKPILLQGPKTTEREEKKDVQYISCLEESSIKIIGGKEEKIKAPLVIPMKPNKQIHNLKEIIDNDFEVSESEIKKEVKPVSETNNDEKLSLNELAARELLNGSKFCCVFSLSGVFIIFFL